MSKIRRIWDVLFEKKENDKSVLKDKHQNKEEELFNRKQKENYLTVLELSQYFHITERELNYIFQKLNWSKQESYCIVMTNLGKYYGARECYDNRTKTKYLKWHKSVKQSSQLIKEIDELNK